MNNTARFYVGFVVALAALIWIAYALGYRAGSAHQRRNDALYFAPPSHRVVVPSPPPPAATATP